jgi:2-keto-4-pentenoate hydratase/2-oxohepta-3-ene-1,7-dioic acid hydratase in catechol pathway
MRIIRFNDPQGETHLGIERGDGSAEVLAGSMFDTRHGLERTGKTARVDRLLVPVMPSNIFCIGLNYREHAREGGQQVPDNPVVFMKPTSSVCHPGDPIRIPAACEHGPEVDYECELAVVIGREARDVARGEALRYVFGYTCANDVSARRWQRHNGTQWVRGKSFDTFCPLGPALVTAEEIPDPQRLAIKTILNGREMQSHTTADMIFPVAELIAFLSQDTTLLPGTVILTGTPQGVGVARKPPVWLKAGDEVVIEIERIGRLVNPVV